MLASIRGARCCALIVSLAALVFPSSSLAATGTTQLLVKFRAGVTNPSAAGAIIAAGGRDSRTITDIGVHVVTVPSTSAAGALASLQANPAVAFAERDAVAKVDSTVTPNDYYYPAEWGLPQVNMPTAWGTTEGSSSVVVAVIDSGLTPSADLQGNVVGGWNFLTGTSNTADDYGHGTQVAGVVAAQSNNSIGVTSYCWNCSVMPVEMIDSSGSGSMSNLASAITWATDHGANVINMSLGGAGTSTVQSAVSYAESKGVVLVASAGNSSCNCAQYPAAYLGVLSVAATDGSNQLESYSNYGPWVQVAAPGTTYSVTMNGTYGSFGGTSAAAPAVAGIAGLLLSADPGASASSVTSAIENSAVNVGSFVAHGRVDAAAALSALLGTSSGATPTSASAPVNTSAPAISGTTQSGQTLTASSGTWSNSPTSYAYQWGRCDSTGANCAAVTGATQSTYSLTSADVGSTLQVSVTASNSGGSGTANSSATAVVSAATQTHTFSGSLTNKSLSQSYGVTVGAGTAGASLSYKCSSTLTLTLKSGGTTVASATGPSVLTLKQSLSAGSYTYTVSGPSKCSFTLTITSTAP